MANDPARADAMPMPSCDIIVPCYRYAHFLPACVGSVLAQKGVAVRILIIDDASPDHTEEVGRALARRDERVVFRRHEANRGHIATYNEGIDWTEAGYLLLLSADDYLLPGALGRACRLMQQAPDVGFAFGNALVQFADGETKVHRPLGSDVGGASLIMTGAEFVDRSGASNIVPTPTAVVRTTLQKRIGGYRADLPHSGDMEMWLRLASHAKVGFVNADQGVYRRHEANMSLDYEAGYALADLMERRKALATFFATGGQPLATDDGRQRMLLRSLARQAVGKASTAFNAGDLEATEAISRLAVDICSGIRTSSAWARLALKRAVGPSGWQTINATRSTVSGWVSALAR